jgi:TolB-like protein
VRRPAATLEEDARGLSTVRDAVAGHRLWAELYDRDVNDTFGVQDQISQTLVIALKEISTAEHRAP